MKEDIRMKTLQSRESLKSLWTSEPMKDTDQLDGIPMPPFEDPFNKEELIYLPYPKSADLKKRDIVDILSQRQSRRKLGGNGMDMTHLSFLLWASQGMREMKGGRIFRTVPSAGSRHPFETYFYADRVDGLKPGLYRYIASENAVLPVSYEENLKDELKKCVLKQWFNCAVALFWVINAYRCEWRYTYHSHKVAAFDAGHICQNAYLAAEALDMGFCAIGAYLQEETDRLLGVDGENEFTCYIGVFGPLA